MKINNKETVKIIVDVFIRKICEGQARKTLAMSEVNAEEFGAINEEAINEQEKDKFYEDFVLKNFTKNKERTYEF